MSQHKHGQEEKSGRAGPPKWVMVVAVVLMLAGIAAYILSMDEALAPVGVPATPATSPSTGATP